MLVHRWFISIVKKQELCLQTSSIFSLKKKRRSHFKQIYWCIWTAGKNFPSFHPFSIRADAKDLIQKLPLRPNILYMKASSEIKERETYSRAFLIVQLFCSTFCRSVLSCWHTQHFRLLIASVSREKVEKKIKLLAQTRGQPAFFGLFLYSGSATRRMVCLTGMQKKRLQEVGVDSWRTLIISRLG